MRGDGPVQLPYLTIYVSTYGREFSVSSPQTDTTNQQRATSETKQTPKAHQIQLRGEGFLVLLAAPPPRAARVGSSGGGGYFDVGSPASWRFKKRKENLSSLCPSPSRAGQQQRSFWGTVDMVASRPQGSPLRRDAQAGDRAVAVHRRPRDETTQMPAAHPR